LRKLPIPYAQWLRGAAVKRLRARIKTVVNADQTPVATKSFPPLED
jgi:hypothetical protein